LSSLIAFVVATLLMTGCLWAGMKLTHVDGSLIALAVIAAIATALQLLIGWLGSMVGGETGAGIAAACGWVVVILVMLVLISKWTDADFWPDAVLMVLVANLVAGVATWLIGLA
jgi:hypothetical protein